MNVRFFLLICVFAFVSEICSMDKINRVVIATFIPNEHYESDKVLTVTKPISSSQYNGGLAQEVEAVVSQKIVEKNNFTVATSDGIVTVYSVGTDKVFQFNTDSGKMSPISRKNWIESSRDVVCNVVKRAASNHFLHKTACILGNVFSVAHLVYGPFHGETYSYFVKWAFVTFASSTVGCIPYEQRGDENFCRIMLSMTGDLGLGMLANIAIS